MTKPTGLNDDEARALRFVLAHHVEGAPADAGHVAAALVILARRRPYLTIGRMYIAAAIAANLSRAVNPEGIEQ